MKFKSYYIDEDDNCENNEVSVLSCIHTFLANKLELKIYRAGSRDKPSGFFVTTAMKLVSWVGTYE